MGDFEASGERGVGERSLNAAWFSHGFSMSVRLFRLGSRIIPGVLLFARVVPFFIDSELHTAAVTMGP